MELLKLNINFLRNLNAVEIEPDVHFNVFYGENGAGKTSILEAIHVLSNGRSFRGSKVNPLIQHTENKLWVTGKISQQGRTQQVGVERSKRGLLARIDGKSIKSILYLSECFPTLALHPETFNFLSAEPAQRRSFLDWGTFHEDPRFIDSWRLYRQSLKQRNSALRQGLSKKSITLWEPSMVEAGEYINKCRKEYISKLLAELPALMNQFGQDHHIDIELKQGWSDHRGLQDSLEHSLEGDIKSGYTHPGPHRADVLVSLNTHSIAHHASRGQLKLVTVLLKLAQCSLFVRRKGSSCILLLDDLAAELDRKYFLKVLDVIIELKLQSFITTIEPIRSLVGNKVPHKLFHVKHGLVNEVV